MTGIENVSMPADVARASIARARTHLDAAAAEIVAQVSGRAWIGLHYADWDEMRAAEYGGAAVIVPRADRPQLVARLRTEGLTQQSIADTVGVGHQTIGRDLANVHMDIDLPSTIDTPRGPRPSSYRSTVVDPAPDLDAADAARDLIEAEPSVQDARYLHSFAVAVKRCVDLTLFDPDRLAPLVDDGMIDSVDRIAGWLTDARDTMRHNRSGLRVVNGGRL